MTIRRREQAALDSIVERLEADDSAAAGAGVTARIEQDIRPDAGQR